MITLRDYQRDLIERIRGAWASGTDRVLACLPTGAGKTEVAIELLLDEASTSHRALVLVERKVLCQQWVERIHRHAPAARIGIIQAENTVGVSSPILVATAQTIRSRGVPEDVGLIVIDESHVWHTVHDDVLRESGGAKVLGLTATPLREGLGLRFERLIVGTTIRTLIEQGYLVRPRYFAPRHSAIETALNSVSIRAGDYATNELGRAMRGKSIIGDVVGTWLDRGEDRQTIAFCVDKQHAHDLADEFTAARVTARSIVDETPDDERRFLFREFDGGTLRVLCSVGVLGVGFDAPIASCAILARPTLSLSLHIQQGGRVLRPHPGKSDCLILDHAGNTIRHGLLDDFEPPADLSQIERSTDKRNRRDAPEAWICRHCEAVNPMREDVCAACGNPRRRHSAVYVIDGEIMPLYTDDPRAATAPTADGIETFYRQCVYYGMAKGFRDARGWAYHQTAARYRLVNPRAVIAWSWRNLEPIRPSAETARWLRAEWQRRMIARRYATDRTVPAGF